LVTGPYGVQVADGSTPVRRDADSDARTDPTETSPAPAEDAANLVLLAEPRDGIPDPVADEDALAAVVEAFAAGRGPVAVDAERASGYRYTQRAYLVQLRRDGAGTVLVDPVPLPDLTALNAVISDTEWVLHAASQDLPCLSELGLRPTKLFDTELASRLAGFERVGLAAITERLLGYTLEKHHSAADWSTRPLPRSWLSYAALDVELLVDLRDHLAEELTRQGKLAWAEEEFAALTHAGPARPRPDPWRRTSGIHRVRGARGLARVRALWLARDEVAQRRDVAPGRVLPDSAIVGAAQADPTDERALLAVPGFGNRNARRLLRTWLEALAAVRDTPDAQLPPATLPSDGPPPPHRWAERDPAAAERLSRARAAVTAIATEHHLPTENLIAPDTVRRLAWEPPDPLTGIAVREFLAAHGARPWQVELTHEALTAALDQG
jgi:ribonuclease D